MKKQFNPDYRPLRKKEYQKRDGELLAAICDCIDTLCSQGIDIGEKMRNELAARDDIRRKFKKTNQVEPK